MKHLLLSCLFLLSLASSALAGNFIPGETIPITVTTTSTSAAFTIPQSASYPDVMVTNDSSGTIFYGCSNQSNIIANSPASGVVNATPVKAGEIAVFSKGNATSCAAIAPSGSGTVYFTAGQGN